MCLTNGLTGILNVITLFLEGVFDQVPVVPLFVLFFSREASHVARVEINEITNVKISPIEGFEPVEEGDNGTTSFIEDFSYIITR